MKRLKPYFSYMKLRIICELQYRSAALAGMSTQFFFGFIYIMLYLAFYNGAGTVEVSEIPIISILAGPSTTISIGQMVTYLWLFQAFYYMVIIRQMDNELLDMIKNGNIAYEMCKPMNIYLTWFMKILSKKTIGTLLRFWPIVIVAFFLPEPFRLELPSSYIHFILFIVSLIFALIIACILILFIHIITFYTLKDKGATSLVVTIGEIFTGGIVPIVFMPKVLQVIAYLLPFRYVGDLPFRIYNGTLDISTSLINIGMQVIWIVLLGFISYKLMNRALKRVVVQGG